ncbi:hypothetical protein HF086_017924 [Spodoptera exigua]|uniref:Uncharacterized protein n=1 Tax=Spodoptera exigua TaxID=7107 RepID=A0A922SFU2_SPOEX|nr:hypothetical protein HF086_017924 [Spodoptera exigua]
MILGVLFKCLIARVCVVEEFYGKYDENGQCEVITREKIQGIENACHGLQQVHSDIYICVSDDDASSCWADDEKPGGEVPSSIGSALQQNDWYWLGLFPNLVVQKQKDANAEETKMIKDFIRLIKKNPLQINLISNFPAGMNLLPVIVMLFFNYLIVILQFNHVI